MATTNNPDLKIGAGCTVCTEATVVGDVTIGAGTVVHPRAQILAESGPIVIGDNNLIEENACIINSTIFVMHTIAVVGPDVELTNGCIIGTMCELITQETLPANTIIIGRDCQRRMNAEKPALQTSQLEFLRKVLPNYHYLVSSKK